jgi:hypothetical protein
MFTAIFHAADEFVNQICALEQHISDGHGRHPLIEAEPQKVVGDDDSRWRRGVRGLLS